MSIKSTFTKHQEVWDDCYLGYTLTANSSGKTGQDAIRECLSDNNTLNFYPWLNEKETITFPCNGLTQVSPAEFENLFLEMAKEAIRYGSEHRLSDSELRILLASFREELVNSTYFSNFTKSGWSPLTKNSRDSFLCAVGENKIGMWLSCDDE